MIIKTINTYIIPILCSLVLIASCSRRDEIIEHFEVQKGDLLVLPIKHTRFPYPQTNIYFEFDPAIKNHESRDFSDVISIKAYNNNSEIEEIRQIYDINGAGRTIQISFKNEKAQIKTIEISFNIQCSGKVDILSWQPL